MGDLREACGEPRLPPGVVAASLALCSYPGAPLCPLSWLGPLRPLQPSLWSRNHPRLTPALSFLHLIFALLRKLSPAGYVAASWPHSPQPCLLLEGLSGHLIFSRPSVHLAFPTRCTSRGPTALSLGPCHRGESVAPSRSGAGFSLPAVKATGSLSTGLPSVCGIPMVSQRPCAWASQNTQGDTSVC